MKKGLLVLIVLSVLIPLSTYSQSNGEKEIALLNQHLSAYNLSFKELLASRGLPEYPNDGKASLNILVNRLRSFVYPTREKFEVRTSNDNYIPIDIVDPVENGSLVSTSILFYHHSGDTLYSWLISVNGIEAVGKEKITAKRLHDLEVGLKNELDVEFSSTGVVAERGDEKKRGITNIVNDVVGDVGDLKSITAELSSSLFPTQVSNTLKRVKHILIIPELNIGSIPLYVLKPFGNEAYLVDSLSYEIAYSFDEFINRHRQEDRSYGKKILSTLNLTPDGVLIVGNPRYASNCKDKFKQLDGAEAESDSIASIFNTVAAKGSVATKSKIVEQIKKSEFIYLATHAVSDPTSPMDGSYVVLSPDSATDCGLWTAREIQGIYAKYNQTYLKPEAIVVLSACQTGLGKAVAAGIIGIGRAFIKAGAQNVILSLWSINDDKTREFMIGFGKELFQPHRFFPSEHLRQAILKMKAKYPDPNVWAAFVNMGTPYSPAYNLRMKNP